MLSALCHPGEEVAACGFTREQAPTNDPISEAALGMVLTLGDFQ